jgi:hypothetical protein
VTQKAHHFANCSDEHPTQNGDAFSASEKFFRRLSNTYPLSLSPPVPAYATTRIILLVIGWETGFANRPHHPARKVRFPVTVEEAAEGGSEIPGNAKNGRGRRKA